MTEKTDKKEKENVAVVRHPKEIQNKLAVYFKEHCHVLSPYLRTNFEVNPPIGSVPVFRETYIDPDKEHGEVYPSEKKGEISLTKVAIEKLSKLAGIVPIKTIRIDDGSHPHVAEFQAIGKIQDLDGSWHIGSPKSYRLDLRDGTPQAEECRRSSEARLAKARLHITALAETKATIRMKRDLLGLLHSYRPDELKKPFVTMKLAPDMEDPENQRMIRAQLLGMEDYLFPKPKPEAPSGTTHDIPASELKDLETLLHDDGTYGIPAYNDAAPPEVPESQPLDPPDPEPDPEPDHEKEAKIKKVLLYYETKTKPGKRDAKKPPLESLTHEQLDEMIRQFEALPDIRPPKEESLI